MMKLQTPVEISKGKIGVSYSDRIMVLGSCFADNIGGRMKHAGFEVMVNPFGTLYNPVSVCNSFQRISSGFPFSENECVEMGAGAGLICSFSHHTSFAAKTSEEFLEGANTSLSEAHHFLETCNTVIITLGTAWCFRHNETGETVSNCLKRPASEFTRYRLGAGEIVSMLSRLIERNPGKRFIFTVSPIRHLKDTAHGNQISKSTLLLAVEELLERYHDTVEYFPAYEIVMDELRDYRFYAEDMVHPSEQTVGYLWERFVEFAVPQAEWPAVIEKEKEFRQSMHRPMHP